VVNGSVIDLNGSGVQTTVVAGVAASAYVSNSEIAFNSTGFNELAGRIDTFGNNRFVANGFRWTRSSAHCYEVRKQR